ncbi:hypothetical protein RLOC_00004992 [Lonchura striata]|uniref:Uncharacterized protein n=1 Tax=Lonchura striata TaxID=40157 RepID=A0A218UP71_9PASE|nr:hypothetical protein RLOC_00004992 [Lonchura striata domestica]
MLLFWELLRTSSSSLCSCFLLFPVILQLLKGLAIHAFNNLFLMWNFPGKTEDFLNCVSFCQPFLGHGISHLPGLGLLAGIKGHCPLKEVFWGLEFLFLKQQAVMLQVSYSFQKSPCVRDRCTLVPVMP